ncbi:MAG: FtsX-like permease family protein [Planctomycetota bacterium]|nr:MAG: FtsX-like permease family protein [Planctomycetota bacterium]
MKTQLAILNLMHQGAKASVSVGGVAFALLLVFMQLGFMGAVSHTAVNVLERLRFDFILRSYDYAHLYEAGTIDTHWLAAVRNVPGVRSARPLWVTIQNWRTLPTSSQTEQGTFVPQFLPIAIYGLDPEDGLALRLKEVEEQAHLLRRPDCILIDDTTHAEYGPWDGRRFGAEDVSRRRTTEIGNQSYRIAGTFHLGTGLASNGLAVMGRAAMSRIWPWEMDRTCSLGLVETESEAADEQLASIIDATKRKLALSGPASSVDGSTSEVLPVEILSRDEMLQWEKRRWLWETPIGLIFQMGVALSLVVGAAIVYMVLATDVANRLPEYATLLAMGYSRKYLCSVVLTQAVVLSTCGFLAAWGVAEALYRAVGLASGIPLIMTWQRIGAVAVLGAAMCIFSGLLALRKLWKAEPANLF